MRRSDQECTIRFHIISDESERTPDEYTRLLLQELRTVHAQLSRLAEERDALAALWDERDGDDDLGSRAGTVRRQLGRLRRRYRAGEVNTLQAGRQLARIGYANTLQGPVEWVGAFRRMRQDAVTATYQGDRPLRADKTPEGYRKASLWREVLSPEWGEDRAFQQAARTLAIKTGDLSGELAWTSELGTTDHRMRLAVPHINGRARELSGWIPRIPGPVTPVQPFSEGRVLHLTTESRPHAATSFTSRIHDNMLAEREAGLEPIVMTALGFPRTDAREAIPVMEELDGITHHRLDTGIDYSRVAADRWLEDFAWLAYQKVRELRPAALHVAAARNGFETGLVALALREKTGIPVVYELHSFYEPTLDAVPDLETGSEVYRRRLDVERLCMLEADAVVATGAAMGDEIVACGVSRDRVTVVPNGITLDHFRPGPRNEALARRYGITGPTIGYVSGGDHRGEGQEILVKASAILKERGIPFHCVLVGNGDAQSGLESKARLHGVFDRMVFADPGEQGDLADHYGLIDVFVVPHVPQPASTYVEPVAPLHAMAMERPVVVSELPALAGIVDAPRRGRTFTVSDPIDLAGAVQDLLDDPQERRRLGTAGRDWVARERQWTHNGPRYRSVYDDVMRRSRRQGPGRNGGNAPASEGA